MIAWVLTDFPDPDSPTMASVLPVSTVNDMPWTAYTVPSSVSKDTRRSRTSSRDTILEFCREIIVLPSVDRSILRRTSHGWRPPGGYHPPGAASCEGTYFLTQRFVGSNPPMKGT